ncbi:MAG: hypothetical protein WAP74_01155 [Patescibacteria group bacterium]
MITEEKNVFVTGVDVLAENFPYLPEMREGSDFCRQGAIHKYPGTFYFLTLWDEKGRSGNGGYHLLFAVADFQGHGTHIVFNNRNSLGWPDPNLTADELAQCQRITLEYLPGGLGQFFEI